MPRAVTGRRVRSLQPPPGTVPRRTQQDPSSALTYGVKSAPLGGREARIHEGTARGEQEDREGRWAGAVPARKEIRGGRARPGKPPRSTACQHGESGADAAPRRARGLATRGSLAAAALLP